MSKSANSEEEREGLISNGEPTPPSSQQPESRKYNSKYIVLFAISLSISGFIYGFDSSSIACANLYIVQDISTYSTQDQEYVSSIAVLGAIVGSLVSGPASNRFGRKKVVVMADVAFIIGAIIQSTSTTVAMILVGRFILGLAMGAATMVVPMLLAEGSPIRIRGAVVTTYVICMTFGQLIGYLICLAFGQNWRLMLSFLALPALFQLMLMYFIPESPRWLFRRNKKQKAIRALRKFFNDNDPKGQEEVESEIDRIEQAENIEGNIPLRDALYELFNIYNRGLLVGMVVLIGQQFSGINILMYYGPTIMRQAGFGGATARDNLINSIPLVNFISSVSAIFFPDTKGRRWLLLRMVPFSALSLIIVSFGYYLIYYLDSAAGPWVTVAGLFLCLAVFSPGLGSQAWVVNSEIHPLQVRSEALSIVTTVNSIFAYSALAIYLSVTTSAVGKVVTYGIAAGFCFLIWVFLCKMLPETKGIPLSQVPELFLSPEKKIKAEEMHLKFFSESSPRKHFV